MATPFTAESIKTLLQTKDNSYRARLERALRLIAAKTNFALGGEHFGKSLLKQLDEGKTLSDRPRGQLDCLCDMLCKSYAATLARLANEKAGIKTETVKQEPTPKATEPQPAPTPAVAKKTPQKRTQTPQKAKESARTAEAVLEAAQDEFYAKSIKNEENAAAHAEAANPADNQWANNIDW